MAGFRSFLAELKRRKVYRVAVVYAVVGLGVVEAADLTLPRLGVPDWGVTLVLALLLLGFPVAIGLAWALEITPEGIKREEECAGPKTGGWVPLVGTLAVLGVVLGAGWWLRSGRVLSPSLDGSERIPIAVLPLQSISNLPDDVAFTDGIHEELLNQLAKISGFMVTSRT